MGTGLDYHQQRPGKRANSESLSKLNPDAPLTLYYYYYNALSLCVRILGI